MASTGAGGWYRVVFMVKREESIPVDVFIDLIRKPAVACGVHGTLGKVKGKNKWCVVTEGDEEAAMRFTDYLTTGEAAFGETSYRAESMREQFVTGFHILDKELDVSGPKAHAAACCPSSAGGRSSAGTSKAEGKSSESRLPSPPRTTSASTSTTACAEGTHGSVRAPRTSAPSAGGSSSPPGIPWPSAPTAPKANAEANGDGNEGTYSKWPKTGSRITTKTENSSSWRSTMRKETKKAKKGPPRKGKRKPDTGLLTYTKSADGWITRT